MEGVLFDRSKKTHICPGEYVPENATALQASGTPEAVCESVACNSSQAVTCGV